MRREKKNKSDMRKYEEKTHSALSNCCRVLFDFFILFTFLRVLFSAFAPSSSSSSSRGVFFPWVSTHFRTFVVFVVYLLISPFAKFDGMETFFPHYHSLWQPPHESWNQIAMATTAAAAAAVEATVRVELTLNSIKRTFRKQNCGFFFPFVFFFYHWY